ncbi:MAG TPA: EAL domain-containing protein [Solirubrobacteraceae bacterium]|nr:EAL domain-containing protein [Solirubrobacteraceae bacterium]
MLNPPAWTIGVGANLTIGACYLAICWLILRGLLRSGQLRGNPLAAATALIFFTCAVHHAGGAIHTLAPSLGLSDPAGLASRRSYTWQMDGWDVVGAAVGILYLSLRSLYGRLLETPAMFADLERERAQAAVASQRSALAEAQAIARLGSWSFDRQTQELRMSEEYLRLFGTTDAAARAGTYLEVIHPEDRERVIGRRARLYDHGEPFDEIFRIQVPGRPEAVLHALGQLEDGSVAGTGRVTGTVQDITEIERARHARLAAEERFRVAFDQGGVATALIGLDGDRRGHLLDVNEAYAHLLGTPLERLRNAPLRDWVHPEDRELGYDACLGRLAEGQASRLQYERQMLCGGRPLATLVTDVVIDVPGEARIVIEQAVDISERKRFESELRHLADHDALTGLFNRRRFEAELERALAHTRRYGTGGAVLALDLDGFKHVNDIFGHAAGDALVTRLAAALKRALRETDVVARTGGDEFAIILPGAGESEARRVAEKLLGEIRAHGTVIEGNRHVHVTSSVGITLYATRDRLAGEDLMVEADIAMYDAKAAGKDTVTVFARDEHRRERLVAHQNWIGRLRGAITENRLVLWAQPIVSLSGETLPRYELLLRMVGDDGDLIPPAPVLDSAERLGFVEEIDTWVLERAVALLEAHHREPGHELVLAVNVSAATLNAGRLVEVLERLLDAHPFPHERLVLEITETAAIANIDEVRELSHQLHHLGVRIALDDFGTGFATFYYLKHLSFDYVKIDGEFIRHLTENRTDQLVVASVVDIARGLGADTIAEFVHDDATLEMLRGFGVGYAQGYHVGRPAPVEELLPVALAGPLAEPGHG